ncbi:MAG: DUF1697 domain-containing protein [Terracidiphilus sp.]|nr:DUF1697 domain-containing protein [Terracidiphilus sp.]
MATYVILLCAVNVGGTGKLPMAELRRLLGGLGCKRVETYIQSGNAVVDATGSAARVMRETAAALGQQMGAQVDVLVRTHAEMERVVAGNPFATEAAADGARVHVAFLSGKAAAGAEDELQQIVKKNPGRRDRFQLGEGVVYLHLPDGAAETKFTTKAMGRAVGCAVTARNWNTVVKLTEMAARE